MLKQSQKRVRLAAMPLLVAFAAVPVAAEHPEHDTFDAAISQAKATMMADSAEALKHARKAAQLYPGDTDEAQKGRLTAQWLEAEALMRLNRADEAAGIIEGAIEAVTLNFAGSKLHADLLRSEAGLKASQGEYGEALDSFLQAHELYEALGEDRSRSIVLQNIGSLYSDARDYERVLSYYKQAHEAYPEDPALALSAHNNTGNALKELNRLVAAEAEFRAALKVASQMDSPLLEARILTNIASTQYLAGKLDAADRTVSLGLNIANSSAPQWRPFLYGVKAQIAVKRGRLDDARMYLARTFEGEDLNTTSPFFRDFHETAYAVYSEAENYKLAAQHLEAFYRIDGQARNLSSTANNALLAARFDAANRELQISTLSLEKAANEARLSSAQNQVILLTALVVLAIFGFIAALLMLRTVNRSRKGIKEANEKLTHVIQHDGLTELYSRDYFRTLLEEAIENRTSYSEPRVLALIDLDRFKQVNDVFGHGAGDQLLAQVAKRFRETAGEDAIIGRLGGDEFAMIVPAEMPIDEAKELSDRIINAVSEPFQIDGFEIQIGASIGLAPIETPASTSVHMTNADLALYAAKDSGRGKTVIYEQSMREKLEDRSSLESDLEAALENGQMSVCYQPIVKGEDRSIICYEALMRWTHPERGIVPPNVFIPVAEEGLLIERLGAWMLREACREATTWPDNIKLTVNISTLQMSDATFLNTVAQALANSGLEPNRLILELTESLVLEMDDQIEQLLGSLKKLGVTFALDDFGSGYSSLNYIDKMDFSMIKIDREFVQSAAAGSPRSQAVVAAIVALAQSLGIEVTAEGIEDEQQAKAMVDLGCSSFQGYLFGRPEPSQPRKHNASDDDKDAIAA
ncbi:EAL domain-containing protein [Erythrobacter sp. SCSIO 43205]|uniref:EAL domain-containing protein n=1 Tax=Erythrobacter sp. SCSIO 43205 TaxID=2779361 RepID=UPI001CA9BA7E|nr:EAL domain-containing protein [Erythrobacter sp. SCSIO 43205]UAB79352.1 EAL domain-containing protein [Erythrobacter sp. SCSIO 43205]